MKTEIKLKSEVYARTYSNEWKVIVSLSQKRISIEHEDLPISHESNLNLNIDEIEYVICK